MASLAVSAISNGTRDANRIIARQQQTVINEALITWVMSQMRVGETAQVQSISAIRTIYNSVPTTKARFNLLVPNPLSTNLNARAGYLDETTAAHFLEYTTNSDRLQSAALDNAKQYLTLPNWQEGDAPRVELVNE